MLENRCRTYKCITSTYAETTKLGQSLWTRTELLLAINFYYKLAFGVRFPVR
jgi:hypothetical protein